MSNDPFVWYENNNNNSKNGVRSLFIFPLATMLTFFFMLFANANLSINVVLRYGRIPVKKKHLQAARNCQKCVLSQNNWPYIRMP